MITVYSLRFLQECRRHWCIFALTILAGAVLGAVFADSAGQIFVSLMCMALRRPVSIVGLVVSYAVPFLVFLYAVIHSKRWLVYLICAAQVFRFTAVSWAIYEAYGSAGWLTGILMQFTDLCLIPAMIFISVRQLTGKCSKRFMLVFSVIIAVVGMVYYCEISPFLANLIDTYETMGRYAIHVGLDWCL